jgi:hypothetical protein
MAGSAEVPADRVRAAAARTSAAGSARLAFGVCAGSSVPGERDWVGEGVVDFAGRRARVSQLLVPERMRDDLTQRVRDEGVPPVWEALAQRHEMLYDGANQFLRAGGRWIAPTLELADRDGPRGHSDPLWSLDALFGANHDVVELAEQPVRDIPTVRYRFTVDLASADALLPAGVTLPEAGPYRRLRRMPTEVWLDAAGRVRRMAIAKTPARRSNATEDQPWTVTEFWEFGVTVMITSPHPGEVAVLDEADWVHALMPGDQAHSPTNPT